MKLVFLVTILYLWLFPLLPETLVRGRESVVIEKEKDTSEEGGNVEGHVSEDDLEEVWEELERQKTRVDELDNRLLELETLLENANITATQEESLVINETKENAVVNGQSCLGRCGQPGSDSTCACTPNCSDTDSCCRDFRNVCLSCRGRCGEPFVRNRLCHCDVNCRLNRNCCIDVDTACASVIKRGASTNDLRVLTEKLLAADTNSVAISIDLQGKGSSGDLAPRPLFKEVPSRVFAISTVRIMEELQSNYFPNVSIPEIEDPREEAEKQAFLDALMQSQVMQITQDFLLERGFLSGSLRDKLEELWFTTYKRKNILSSSGFEHVFAGEVRGQKVLGLHNWVYFLKEEQEGDIDYERWIREIDLGDKGEVIKVAYKWMGRVKKAGSMFVGTSPELEMALYSLCIIIRPNRGCPVQLNGHKFNIQTWVIQSEGKNLVGGAYPAI